MLFESLFSPFSWFSLSFFSHFFLYSSIRSIFLPSSYLCFELTTNVQSGVDSPSLFSFLVFLSISFFRSLLLLIDVFLFLYYPSSFLSSPFRTSPPATHLGGQIASSTHTHTHTYMI